MKQYIALATLATLLFGSASFAFAQTASTTTTGTTATSTTATSTTPTPAPLPPVMQKGEMKLEIGPKGHALIRGNVVSVGTDHVMVKSWGGTWKVKVSASTEILPRVTGTMTDLAKYAVGDYVGAQGVVSATDAWTIDAKVIRDRTERKVVKEERKDNRKEEKEDRKEDRKEEKDEKKKDDSDKKISEGKVDTISGTSFTMVTGSKSINVTTSSTTKFVNRNWNTISFADIRTGDSVRAYGTVSSTTIAAEVVRDTSIPR